jgi:transaldolase
MSRPDNLKTKIFLDGGDPEETKKLIGELGFLDGQTTNPTLISKNPHAAKRLETGQKFTGDEIMDFYQLKQKTSDVNPRMNALNDTALAVKLRRNHGRKPVELHKMIVKEISSLLPGGSVSIEVYSDINTTASQMVDQAKKMYDWIPNAHIKFPTTTEGLKAANQCIKLGFRVNMTLVFSQDQAAAVYAATKGALRGQVFVSPFVGRLDDRGENGMDLIKNILKMYEQGDGHVEVLTASLRNIEHFLCALSLGSDIITAPFKLLDEWAKKGMPTPQLNSYSYNSANLKPIEYKVLDLNESWDKFDVSHQLTDSGIEKFSTDWNTLIE